MFTNTKILIIGGSSGIGLATAKKALDEGAEVHIASRTITKLEHAKAQLNHPKLFTHQVDLLDNNSLQQLFSTVKKLDHLIIPGSEVSFKAFKDDAILDARQSFESKFWGPYQAIYAAIPYLNDHSSITLFSGAASQRPGNGTETISSINGAIESFARSLAVSLAPIRVNTIAPGATHTPVYENLPPQAINDFSKNTIMQRAADANEIAISAIYLMKNTYTTGSTLYVDGGDTLR